MNCCNHKNHLEIKAKLEDSTEFIKNVEKASKVFSLLGEANRLKIVLALLEGELCVYHICEITGCKQSATSQHLAKLKDNNIVKCRKDSNLVLYSIADEHVSEIIKIALEHYNCSI